MNAASGTASVIGRSLIDILPTEEISMFGTSLITAASGCSIILEREETNEEPEDGGGESRSKLKSASVPPTSVRVISPYEMTGEKSFFSFSSIVVVLRAPPASWKETERVESIESWRRNVLVCTKMGRPFPFGPDVEGLNFELALRRGKRFSYCTEFRKERYIPI